MISSLIVMQLTNAEMIKAEIWQRGPVACGLHVTPGFQQYTGGIYSEETPLMLPNHELSLVGYGIANGTE